MAASDDRQAPAMSLSIAGNFLAHQHLGETGVEHHRPAEVAVGTLVVPLLLDDQPALIVRLGELLLRRRALSKSLAASSVFPCFWRTTPRWK